MNDSFDDSPAAMLAMVNQTQATIRRHTEPSPVMLYGVWGGAWFVGFFALWLTGGDQPRIDAPVAGGVLFAALLVISILITAWHIARRVAGVSGPSVTMGHRYSIAWVAAFVVFGTLLGALDGAGASDEVQRLLSPLLASLIVGLLYIGGGLAWGDVLQFRLGLWTTVVVGVAAVVGDPGHLLVLAVLGGGGFLAAAAWSQRAGASR